MCIRDRVIGEDEGVAGQAGRRRSVGCGLALVGATVAVAVVVAHTAGLVGRRTVGDPVSYTHLDVYKRQ